MGGFAFRLMATANENKSSTANPRDYGANVTFTRGALYLFAAWEQHKDNNSGTAIGTAGPCFPAAGVATCGTTATGVSGYEEEGYALGGSFVFGPIKIGGQYQEIEKTGRKDIKNWMGNVVWTVGNHQFIYQYMQSENGALNAAATQPDCDSNNLGWQYNFSRRTFLLTQYTKVKNNDAASCNFGANRLSTPAGTDPQGFSVGIRHVF
jgi:predicted porin